MNEPKLVSKYTYIWRKEKYELREKIVKVDLVKLRS
jgi:hypothetical protein